MGYVVRSVAMLAMLAMLFVTACQSGDSTPSLVTLMTAPEGVTVRSVAAGQNRIMWLEPTGAGKSWQEVSSARADVEHEISTDQQRLASIDYVTLALPDFITTTRNLKLGPADFTGKPLSVEAFGTDSKGERWTLYTWQGPEIPQRPDRPLVHRWVQIYALYDMDAKSLTLLLATIRGEAHE